ncbi:MAG: hypothetical protein JWQ04_1167, partial [Pedosphaera sp.]|nr:hypothetical protein [Pedosphaera sp.]
EFLTKSVRQPLSCPALSLKTIGVPPFFTYIRFFPHK